jgi:hypothetical protein
MAMRGIGVALLIYYMVSAIRSDDFSAGNIGQLAVVAVMAVLAVAIIALTAAELIKKLKAGAFSPKYYSGEENSETREDDGA